MKHELKIWREFFKPVADGSKTFEVRENDRGFQLGDEVELKEWDPVSEVLPDYTGRSLSFRIGYVFPIDEKRVVFSLLPLEVKPG